MTKTEMVRLITTIVKGFAPVLRDQFAALESRLDSRIEVRLAELVEARLTALEQRPQLTYEGTWRPDHSYSAGTAITHRGSLWIATRATAHEPGGGPESGWQLACKRGKDGRDLR